MADKRISQLIERVDIANNDVLPIVASGATTTNKVTISTIQDWMQENLDVGVTSVGITLGSSGTDVNVSGSPITTSGNITINIPTASASNRGLLSAADWSTFNGKQNSITLTTSGTSGEATLVGSTLNIPNYSTGVANAYVPYVGAIGSVNLGYNPFTASQINIDGASPTGGSYLGFKHSNSVNTGTSGYTSMYTFGTNTIAFKSMTGADSKDFSFSMVGITPNVAGGRVYNLPDASGTLALTSDLGGYVTIGTAQTITGSKTFNSRIIGQDATLTSSGSADTLEVTHSSGSGIAVDISKGGNGEGLRVAKTSGSGNAVTITGGTLSAEAGIFSGSVSTGRLTSTGSDFHSFIVPGGTAQIKLERTSSSAGLMYIGADVDGFSVLNPSFSKVATISSTGAATFSGALNGTSASFSGGVTINDLTFINNTSDTTARLLLRNTTTGANAGGLDIREIGVDASINNASNGSLSLSTNNTTRLTISSTGAATFSSSVTANSSIISTTAYGGTFRATDGTNEVRFGSYFNTIGSGNSYDGVIYTTNASSALYMLTGGSTTPRLTISSTGAATFSGNVNITVANTPELLLTDNNTSKTFLMAVDGSNAFFRANSTNSILFQYAGGTTALTLNGSTGAATFNSTTFSVAKFNSTYGQVNIDFQNSGTTFASVGSGASVTSTAAADDVGIGTAGLNKNIVFATGTSYTERMRITSGGNVGIGTSTPSDYIDAGLGLAVYNSSGRAGVSIVGDSTTANDVLGRLSFTNNQSTNAGNKRLAFIDGCRGDDNNSAYLSFSTASSGLGTERMRITSGGYLKASNNGAYLDSAASYHEIKSTSGGSNALVLHHSSANTPYGLNIYYPSASPNSTNFEFIYANDSTQSKFIVWSNGSVVNRTGSYGTISDIKFKENIEDASPKLDDILKLKVRNFNLIGDDKKQIGFIAQEFEEVFPSMVDTSLDKDSEEEYKSIKTSVLIPILVKSIQELKAEIEALKSQING